MGRQVYLKTTPLAEAKAIYFQNLLPFFEQKKTETVPVREALGRVTAAPVFARLSSPAFHSCAMDGIMVQADDTSQARAHAPVVLTPDQFQPCDTGDPLVAPYDAVIMAEDLSEAKDGVSIYSAVHPWEHVRPMGEDIIEQDLLFPQAHELQPVDLSVLLAAGIAQLEVWQRPTIAIIPTGSEIVSGTEALKIGDIIESNTAMFHGMAVEAGAVCTVLPIVPDVFEELEAAVHQAVEAYDVVCMVAGSSAGREDYTARIARKLGEVYVHGVAIRPGKPAILARIDGKPFIGLPGYPVSGQIVFDELVRPLLLQKGHRRPVERPQLSARLTRPAVSSLQHQEYIRVKVGKIGAHHSATPADRGAGASLSLARSEAMSLCRSSRKALTGVMW